MDTKIFTKKISQFKMAVNSFIISYPKDNNKAVINIKNMLPIIKEIDNFLINDDWHNIRVRLSFLKGFMDISIKSDSSEKYNSNQQYIKKKLKELFDSLVNNQNNQVQLIFDEIEDTHDEDIFSKKIPEFKVIVENYLSSYINEKNISVISYIDMLYCDLKSIEKIWKNYIKLKDINRIQSNYNNIKLILKSMSSYLDMSIMIAEDEKFNHKYDENHQYLKKKLNEFILAYPKNIRNYKNEYIKSK